MTSEVCGGGASGGVAAQSSVGTAWSGDIQSCAGGGTSVAGSDVKSAEVSVGAGAHAFARSLVRRSLRLERGAVGSEVARPARTRWVLGVGRRRS